MTLKTNPHRLLCVWVQLDVPPEQVRPLGDRMVIRPDPEEYEHSSGLVLAPSAEDEVRPQTGVVLRVGRGRTLGVAAGDRVIYQQWGGLELRAPDGSNALLISAEEVFGLA